MEVRGTANDAVHDTRDVVISVHLNEAEEPGAAIPPCVGSILRIRPHVLAVVGLASSDFDRAWELALAGQLRYSWLAFTEPHRSRARIVSISLSNEIDE